MEDIVAAGASAIESIKLSTIKKTYIYKEDYQWG